MIDPKTLIHQAESATIPHERARLWGRCIELVLSLEDVREDLTFEEIARMSDSDAGELADHMRAVFKLERPWRSYPLSLRNRCRR
jgi:hypothetical protein